ncbi:MAG: coproporphyrinogen III oxidase family protein, partial [Kiritimatiellae bacterium]|nr:coproporphyrinogen III oxidase family protein [Kiritimatiellia bacterium]
MTGKIRNVYVHVPFCASKCRYCAFSSMPRPAASGLRAYPALLRREIEARAAADARPDTLYAGGGTPSRLG